MGAKLDRRAVIRMIGFSAASVAAGGGIFRTGSVRAAEVELLATGESAAPAPTLAWRVLRDEVDNAGSELLERAAGFVIPERGAGLFVTDNGDGVIEIPRGGAHYVSEGGLERYSSMDENVTRYLRLSLVIPEDAEFAADGQLVLAGPAMDVDPTVGLDLHRIVLRAGEEVLLPAGDYGPPLVVADGGGVEFSANNFEPDRTLQKLRSGQAAVLLSGDSSGSGWKARLPGATKDAVVLVGTIHAAGGESVSPDAFDAGKADGIVHVWIEGCASFPNPLDGCSPISDITTLETFQFALRGPVNPDGTPLPTSVFYYLTTHAVNNADGSFTFNVPGGVYLFMSFFEAGFLIWLDDLPYSGETFNVSGTHQIVVRMAA